MSATAAHQKTTQRDALAAIFGGESAIAERLPMLPVVLEKAANSCAEELRSFSALMPQLRLIRISGGTVAQLLDPEPGSSVVEMLHAPGWEANVLIRLEKDLVLSYLEMALGGDGTHPPIADSRPLTRIEANVARTLASRMGRALEPAFSSIAETAFTMADEPERIDPERLGGASAPVAIARFRVEFGSRGGELSLAIPRAVLTALRPALAHVPLGETTRADPGWSRQMQNELTRTRVMLRAILEERMKPLSDISNLAVGQVLELEASPRSRIRVECNGEPLLWCEIGKSNGVYTLRVDGFIDHDQEFMDGILTR